MWLMRPSRLMKRLATLLGAALLVSCAPSGGGNNMANGGIGGTGITTSGQITGFGSIWVNGKHFQIDTANVSLNGNPGDDQDAHKGLRIGMVVTVTGTLGTDGINGTADVVSFVDEMQGVVQANNVTPTGGTLTVMGQVVDVTAVQADPANRFEDDTLTYTTLADVPPGAVVEVSGYNDGMGTIYATRIEVKDDSWQAGESELEVKGVVSELNALAKTFVLGGLTVDYNGASQVPAGLADGQYVEAKTSQALNGNILYASEVDLEDGGERGVTGSEGDEVEVEGIITSDFAGTSFAVNGQQVVVAEGASLHGAATSDLVEGLDVHVHGTLNADGSILADEVELED